MKRDGAPIAMLTAYDFTSAQIADRAGVPMLLVGDSLGMVMLGHDTTLPVTLDDMVRHAGAVVRGSANALIVGDLPFLTYASEADAVHAARRMMQEAGVQAVKLEGGRPRAPIVKRLVELGVPVMGHLGYTPQSTLQIGIKRAGQGRRRRRGADRGRPGAGSRRRLRRGAGADPRRPRRRGHAAPDHPHHRHRRGAGLRRPGAGLARHPRSLRRQGSPSTPRSTARSARLSRRRSPATRTRSPSRAFPPRKTAKPAA